MPPRKRAAAGGKVTLKSVQAKNKAALEEADNERSRDALRLRREGKDWWEIAEALRITEKGAKDAYSRAITVASEMVSAATKRELLMGELDLTYAVQAQLWPLMQAGNVAAANSILAIAEKRVKWLGLDVAEQNPNSVTTTVVVAGKSEEYIQALREIAESNGGHDVVEGEAV